VKPILIRALIAAAAVVALLSAESVERIVVKKPFDPNVDGRASARHPPVLYHGGVVLNQKPAVYVIFYGSFAPTTSAIVKRFLTDINGPAPNNPYEVNTGYDNTGAGTGTHIQPTFFYTPNAFPGDPNGSLYNDNYSLGKGTMITGAGVVKILHNAFAAGLPASSNAVYFVLTSPDVTARGFCSNYCAYHSNHTVMVFGAGVNIRYALVPDPTQACSGCDGNVVVFGQNNTPNGDMGADSMTDSIIHELSESVTDPDGTAWYAADNSENADLCNYRYGPGPYLMSNGANANFENNGHFYLIQRIWKRAAGPCASNP
jgi:hypothetical protein